MKSIFTTDEMIAELGSFDPIAFKYYYKKSQSDLTNEIKNNRAAAQRYANIVKYERSHQMACLTKRNYADDYANLNLVYGERENTLCNINLLELVLNKWISQYINIDGMERLFSETYIEFEWEMHLSADYKKHNMEFYRDHFFHQVKDTYMMYILLRDYGFYERIRDILLNESESKVSRFVCRSRIQQQYQESDHISSLRSEKDDPEFYIRNMIYMASFMAGLFHDIGYPERYYKTTSRHIRDYIACIHELNSEGNGINRIYSLLQNSLLFRVEPFENIENRIQNSERADHGALSAVIFLLHFYENGAIYTLSPYKKAAVELAALAIYNHTNKYGIQGAENYTIYRPCFPLNPISYLLRICDDLQEWERIYFVISDRSNIVFCNDCKTPVMGFREDTGKEWITRYRCNCQFLRGSGDMKQDKSKADRQIQAFDGRARFSYRRIYNVSVCDKVEVEESLDNDGKILFRLHYDPYKLLHVAYLNGTYAKFRIKELNSLKKLFECQKGIPKIYLDYFVTSNPIHIKVRLLEEYLEHKDPAYQKYNVETMFEADADRCLTDRNELENWINSMVEMILKETETLKKRFINQMPRRKLKSDFQQDKSFNERMEEYLDISLNLYARLLVYQWINEYLNNYRNDSYDKKHQEQYNEYKALVLSSEWEFGENYFKTPELRCMIEDCFLQFTRMYLDVKKCRAFPKEYYEQYTNGNREKIFAMDYTDANGAKIEIDVGKSKKYFNESEEYYYKALERYMDAELYKPLAMIRKERDTEIDVVGEKMVDAYTDLYLFYLMDQEIRNS